MSILTTISPAAFTLLGRLDHEALTASECERLAPGALSELRANHLVKGVLAGDDERCVLTERAEAALDGIDG